MERNELGRPMIYVPCGCGSRYCSGSAAIQPDKGDNGERTFMLSVDVGDSSGAIWLSVEQLRGLVNDLESLITLETEGTWPDGITE